MPKEEVKKLTFVEWLEGFLKGIDDAEIAEVSSLATAIAEKKELSVVEAKEDLKEFATKIVFDASNFLLKSDKQYFDKESFQKLTPKAKLFELLANYDQHNRTLKDGNTQSENSIVFKQNTYTSNHGDDKIWTVQIRNEKNEILTAIFKGGALLDCLKDASKTDIQAKTDVNLNIDSKICKEFDELVAKNGYTIKHNGGKPIKTADLANKAVDKSSGVGDEGIDTEPVVKMPKSAVPKLLGSLEAVATEAVATEESKVSAEEVVTEESKVSATIYGKTKDVYNYAKVAYDGAKDKYDNSKAAKGASIGAFAGSLGGTFGGVLAGAAAGAAIGSIVPGLGTAAGATVGATVGALAGAGAGTGAGFFAGWRYGAEYSLDGIEKENDSPSSPYFSPCEAFKNGGRAGAYNGAWAGAGAGAGAVAGPAFAAHAASLVAGKVVVAKLVGSNLARGAVGAVKGGCEEGLFEFFCGFGRGVFVGQGAWLSELPIHFWTESALAKAGVVAAGMAFDCVKPKPQGQSILSILFSGALSEAGVVFGDELASVYYLGLHYKEKGDDNFWQREFIKPIGATVDAVNRDFLNHDPEFFKYVVETKQKDIATHLWQLDPSLKEELSKLGFKLDVAEQKESPSNSGSGLGATEQKESPSNSGSGLDTAQHPESSGEKLSSGYLVFRDQILHNMFLQHKDSLNTLQQQLVDFGLLQGDDFQFSAPHTTSEMNDELTKMMNCLNNNKNKLNNLHALLVDFGLLKEEHNFKFSDLHTTSEMNDELTKMMNCLNSNKERLDSICVFLVNFGLLQDDGFKFVDNHTTSEMNHKLIDMMGCLNINKENFDSIHNVLVNFGLLKDDNFKFIDNYSASEMCNKLIDMMNCLNSDTEKLNNIRASFVNLGLLQDDGFKFSHSNTASEMGNNLTGLIKMMNCLNEYSNKEELDKMHNRLATFGLLPPNDDFKFLAPHTTSERWNGFNNMMGYLNSNKNKLDNLHLLLVNSGSLQDDGFKFADSHTAKDINSELEKMFEGFNKLNEARSFLKTMFPSDFSSQEIVFSASGDVDTMREELKKMTEGFNKLNTIRTSLTTIFPPQKNDNFTFSASGDVNTMNTNLTEMRQWLQKSGFQEFVNTVKSDGVNIDDIKETTNISNVQDNFNKLKEDVCKYFHKGGDAQNIKTFKELEDYYKKCVADAKAKADAEADAAAAAASKAKGDTDNVKAAQGAQNIANPGLKVTIGSQSVVDIVTNGGTVEIKTSPAGYFQYNKIYELQTVNGYRVCGLSHDSGKEISGLLVMKDNQVVCFESSVVNGNHRDVHAFIKEDNAWSSFFYNTLGLSGNGNDNINDDGVLLDQKVAQLLNKAFGRKVASEELLHRWQPRNDSGFSAFFGFKKNLLIFANAIERPSSIFIIKQADSRLLEAVYRCLR